MTSALLDTRAHLLSSDIKGLPIIAGFENEFLLLYPLMKHETQSIFLLTKL